MNQAEAARRAMAEWLADEHELGSMPECLEQTQEFDLHDLHYYIFRYKPTRNHPDWLLGVAGGYEKDALDHCGHVFSEMEVYQEANAVDQAIALVEQVRAYCMREAAKQEEAAGIGPFAGFVLLREARWDPRKLAEDLRETWQIEIRELPDDPDQPLVAEVDGMTVAVSLMGAPVPDQEAERNAENNYLWPQAVERTKLHQAHLLVAVLGRDQTALSQASLYTKLAASCCRQAGVLGVYTTGTVYEPELYREVAEQMNEGELPIYDWVYLGLYRSEAGMCAYTYGLQAFGKREMEVLDSAASPQQLHDFLYALASYALDQDVTLNDGETIGFSAEEKLPITCGPGRSLDQTMLQISYQPA